MASSKSNNISWMEKIIPPSLLTIITTLFYYPSLNYPFQFDDIANITKNFDIRFMDNIQIGNRWIGYLLNKINYRIGRFDPFYYRSLNVLVHLLSGLALFYTILFLCKGFKKNSVLQKNATLTAFMSSGIFLLHPVQTQAVSYVIQARLEGLACFFVLLSALFLISFARAKSMITKGILTTLLLLSGFIACGTKEIAIMSPFLLLIMDWFLIAKQDWSAFKKRIWIHVAFSLVVFGTFLWFESTKWFTQILGLKIQTGNNKGNIITNSASDVIKPYDYLISEFKVILHYLAIFIWPFSLSVEYDWKLSSSIFAPDSFFPLLALLIIGYFILYNALKKQYPTLTFGLLWFFIAIAPRASIVPSPELICDYKTYMASVGWIFAISVGIVYAFDYLITQYRQSTSLSKATYITLGVLASVYTGFIVNMLLKAPYETKTFVSFLFVIPLAISYAIYYMIQNYKKDIYTPINKVVFSVILLLPVGYGAMERNVVWSCPVEFWKDIVNKAPLKARGHNNYGVSLSEEKQYHDAIKHYKEAIRLDSNYCDPHSNLAVSYSLIGKTNQAIAALKNALKIFPNYPEAYNNLGSFLLQKKDYDGAEHCFKLAIQLRKYYGKAHMNLGRLYLEKNERTKAWDCFVNATQGDLDNKLGYVALGEAAVKLEKYSEAIKAFETAIKMGQVGPATIFNLANSYFMTHKFDNALGLYKQLCKNEPNNTKYLYNMGETLFTLKRYQEALNVFNAAKDLPDAIPQTHLKLVKCLKAMGNVDDTKRYLKLLQEAEGAPDWFLKEVNEELTALNTQHTA